MRDVLKIYKIKLTALGPIYIGSGEPIIGKKEYFLSNNNRKLNVINPEKLYQFMKKQGILDKYEKFILDKKSGNLYSFLKENQIPVSRLQEAVKYTLECDEETNLSERLLEIYPFVKDAYGIPYIPGSTLKGMLRNVLLAYEIEKQDNIKRNYQKKISSELDRNTRANNRNIISGTEKSLESDIFHLLERNNRRREDAVNDVMSGFIVSDSEPLTMKDMILAKKYELHINGTERKLNVVRESICPGTEIKFTLTIDTSICPYSKEDIENAIKKFSETYYECFLRKFKVFGKPKQNTVWIGGGAGYLTKTITYPLFGDKQAVKVTQQVFKATMLKNKFHDIYVEHNHPSDVRLGVSPHIAKITKYNGQKYQFGQASLSIEEIL